MWYLQESFETSLNIDRRCAHYLAVYVDDKMKKGAEGDNEALLDSIVNVFK